MKKTAFLMPVPGGGRFAGRVWLMLRPVWLGGAGVGGSTAVVGRWSGRGHRGGVRGVGGAVAGGRTAELWRRIRQIGIRIEGDREVLAEIRRISAKLDDQGLPVEERLSVVERRAAAKGDVQLCRRVTPDVAWR